MAASVNQEAKEELFKELGKSYVSGITLSGGDPLHPANRLDIRALLHEIREKISNENNLAVHRISVGTDQPFE